jgi:hypothetical protein
MALPKILLHGRMLVLLSRFKEQVSANSSVGAVVADDEAKLQQPAKRDADAVAFGYVAEEWVAAA